MTLTSIDPLPQVAPTPEQFAAQMRAIQEKYDGDHESTHGRGDDLMCATLRAMGYADGVGVYESGTRWCA